MKEITVTTQAEFDAIPADFRGYIYIKNTTARIGVARENSSIEARENSSVEAWGNSSVVARGNSSVVAWGNVQIAQYSDLAKLTIHGNARVVHPPRNIEEFCAFHGITTNSGAAIFYKAVRADNTDFRTGRIHYDIGAVVKHFCAPASHGACAEGLHIAHRAWAIDFGRSQNADFRVVECAVPLSAIVYPDGPDDGKVRTSELTVLREVPLAEWGIYGKIVAKQRTAKTQAG